MGAKATAHLPKTFEGIKRKDLIGIPWMLAFALRDDGWYLRQDIIWAKRNPMPESVRDRCTKSHEYVFMLTKNSKYYFDHTAMQEDADEKWEGRYKYQMFSNDTRKSRPSLGHNTAGIKNCSRKRNKRDVWFLPSSDSCREAHFATYPKKLVEPCVLSSCPVGGVVLDPFSGSGTTGIVALQHGRSYIGIELNPDYNAIALRRIRKECSQLRLEV